MNLYDHGRDELRTIATDTLKWALVTGGSFDPSDHFVSSVITAEVTRASYLRQTLTGGTRTVNTTAHQTEYTCDTPDWGTLEAGEDVIAVVLFKFITNDAASIPIGWQDLTDPVPTEALDPFTFTVFDGTIAVLT